MENSPPEWRYWRMEVETKKVDQGDLGQEIEEYQRTLHGGKRI